MNTEIISYCRITPDKIIVNGKPWEYTVQSQDILSNLAELYQGSGIKYPKFFKMDKLCKLGFLAAELTIAGTPDWDDLDKSTMGLIFSNNSSSIESDRVHAASIADKQNFFPSPSVFVYTLANIVSGEIAIRNKITGENAFFISEEFDTGLISDYCNLLFNDNKIETALAGWINADGAKTEALVYCLKKSNFSEAPGLHIPHNSESLKQLYNS